MRGDMTKRAWISGALTMAVLFVACSELAGPEVSLDSVDLRLSVTPAVVPPGGELISMVEIRNRTDREVRIPTSMSCLYYLTVRRSSESVGFPGSGYLCLAVGNVFRVPARGTLESVDTIVAATHYGQLPAPPGAYTLEVRFNHGALPGLTHWFLVR